MLIRSLQPNDDRLAVSRVYEESWKQAYRGIVPQAFLDGIPAGHWADRITRRGYHNLVALDGEQIVGASAYCASRFPEFPDCGEVVSLYLLPEYWGRGYGKALLSEAVRGLAELSFRNVFLWVLEDNARARRFYEHFGFTDSGVRREDDIGGRALREVQYCWHE